MRPLPVILALLLVATTAHAATTNLNNQRIRTYDLFAEGKATIGTAWNTTEWGLVVVNGTTLNSTARFQATTWHEGAATFNSTVNFVDGSIARVDLPSTLAYEDEANTFSVRQVYSDGFTAGANAYHNALLQANSTTLVQWLYAAGVIDVNGTFTASTNSYLEGPLTINGSFLLQRNDPVAILKDTAGTAANQVAYISLQDSTGSERGWMGFGDGNGDFRITQANANDLIFAVNGGYRLIIRSSGATEVEGDLDHDGSNVGFYSKAPVGQAADIVQVTDSTGGTAGNTCAAITAGALYSQADMTAVKNCLASLIAKINALDTAIDDIGITA